MFDWRKPTGRRPTDLRAKRRTAQNRRSRFESLEARRLLAREVAGTLTADDTWNGTIRLTSNVTVPETVPEAGVVST